MYSDEELIEDLQRVIDELGRAPTTKEYNEHGIASASTISNRFGGWANALRSLGYEPQGSTASYTDEELIEDLQRVIDKLGRAPTTAEYNQHGIASAATVDRRFESWSDALRSLGYEPQGTYTDEELKDDLQRVIDKLGRTPTVEEYNHHGIASYKTIDKRFESWADALGSLGYETHGPTEYTDEELIEDLQRVIDELGRAPTTAEYNQHGIASARTIDNHLGWVDALRSLGYETQGATPYTDEELIEDLQRVIDELGRPPTTEEYDQYGVASDTTIKARFEGFNPVIKSLGYQPHGTFTDEEIKQGLQRIIDKLGRPPTAREYDQYSHDEEACAWTIANRLGGYNATIRSLGYEPNQEFDVSQEAYLKDLRRIVEQTTGPQAPCVRYKEFDDSKFHIETIHDKFENRWKAIVRAGITPYHTRPLTPAQYKSFIHNTLDSKPLESFYGQLMAFTGLTTSLLSKLNFDWISRLESRRNTLITVPADQLRGNTGDDWVVTVPEKWTDPVTGTTKQTTINELLMFLRSHRELMYRSAWLMYDRSRQFAEETDIATRDVRLRLRATSTVHLAKREIPTWKIKHQIGAEKTGWRRSVEDYYLYIYQFHGITHPDYEPSGVYLDPDSGDVKRVDSEAN